tara:strand:+ start:120 stop:443 length:324 start_codon:yes stop_codon:yes gene_type:complete
MQLGGSIWRTLLMCSIALFGHAQETVDNTSYRHLLTQVETMAQHALDHHYSWRDTRTIISAAKSAASENNFSQAIELLKQAKLQYELSRQQAERQTELTKIVPYYLQ